MRRPTAECPQPELRRQRAAQHKNGHQIMAHAEGERQRAARALVIGERLVGSIAIDLQHAAEASEMAYGMFGAAAWRIEIDHRWRIGARPPQTRLRVSAF
jgi:hypothetical protein